VTLEKYNKFKEDFFKEEAEKYEYNKKLFLENEKEYDKYHQKYMTFKTKYFEDMQEYTIEQCIKALEETKEEIEETKLNQKPDFMTELHTDCSYWGEADYEINDISIKASWYEVIDDETFTIRSRNSFRETIGKMLKTDKNPYGERAVGCKVLEMFENEEITWKGMQKLTYGACDL
jgi:hypothetical protein